jgi:hypothetical protein
VLVERAQGQRLIVRIVFDQEYEPRRHPDLRG